MQVFVGGNDLDFGMRMFMGSFFLIFGAFKLVNLKKFAEAYKMYDLLAKRYQFYGYLYPFIELGLAFLYLADIGGVARDAFTLIIMTVSAAGVIIKLRRKETIPCACLGMVFVLPMTWVTLVEDVLMAIEALFMLLMPIGFQLISLDQLQYVLGLHLQIHDSMEWVKNSQNGHLIVGIVMILFVISSLIERKAVLKKAYSKFFVKYFAPILLISLGLSLSIVDSVYHAAFDSFEAVTTLILIPNSQWFQHFSAGILLTLAGVGEWIRTRKPEIKYLRYAVPVVVLTTGVGFFFHQQLGALDAIVNSMIWHMSFGALLVVGAVMRIIDLFLFEERRFFFGIWALTLFIAFGMMAGYSEPPGAYELATPEQEIQFQERLDGLQDRWSLF